MADKELATLTDAAALAVGDKSYAVQGGNSREPSMGQIWSVEVITISATSDDLDPAHVGGYQRWTSNSAKTLTIQPNSTTAQPDNGEWNIRNVGNNNLTLVAGVGVTINPPNGGSLVIPKGGTVTLKRGAINDFDLIGTTVAADTAVTATATQTLTNKELVTPKVTSFLSGLWSILLPSTQDTQLVGRDTVDTLTNKRISPRCATPVANVTTTLAPNWDTYDQIEITAQAGNLAVSADAGTPVDGQEAYLIVKDNASTRNITFASGSSKSYLTFTSAIPAGVFATVAGKRSVIWMKYSAAAARWMLLSVSTEQ